MPGGSKSHIVYEGHPPKISESDIEGQRIWLKVSETHPVQDNERVIAKLDKDLIELFKEIHFWKFFNAILDIKFRIASHVGDDEEMLRLKIEMKRAFEQLQFKNISFWCLIKEKYDLWDKLCFGVRVSADDIWTVVEVPVQGTFRTIADEVRRLLDGEILPPESEP